MYNTNKKPMTENSLFINRNNNIKINNKYSI